MSAYTPHTPGDIAAMLEAIGVGSLDELVAQVPERLRATAGVGAARRPQRAGAARPLRRARGAQRR